MTAAALKSHSSDMVSDLFSSASNSVANSMCLRMGSVAFSVPVFKGRSHSDRVVLKANPHNVSARVRRQFCYHHQATMASSEDVILYTHAVSSYAQRVQVAMVEKGIPFKPVYIDFFDKPAGLLEANPIYAKVPTLVHGKNSISESLIILEYLDEAWPGTTPLLPKDCAARAKARFWADYIYKGFVNLQKAGAAKPSTPEREAGLAEMPKFFKIIEDTMVGYSAEGPFFTGDKFDYLDVILLPFANWIQIFEKILQTSIPGPDDLPRLHKWMKTMREHKSYKEVIVSDEEIWDIYSRRVKKRNEVLAAAAAAAAAKGK